MNFFNKKTIEEQINEYVPYDVLVFPDSNIIRNNTGVFLSLLKSIYKNRDKEDSFFTKRFIEDNHFSDEIKKIITSQHPIINPVFEDVKPTEVLDKFFEVLLDTGKLEERTSHYVSKKKIEEEEAYWVYKENSFANEYIQSATKNHPFISDNTYENNKKLQEIIPEFKSLDKNEFVDYLMSAHKIFIEGNPLGGRRSTVDIFNDPEREALQLKKTDPSFIYINSLLSRYIAEMIAEVFYKEITEHFKKATFLKMHTDGSGDLSFSDLKEYKLASGTFQDVAYIRYYEYLNENIFNYLTDDAPKIESMTFSFQELSPENVNQIRESVNYTERTAFVLGRFRESQYNEGMINSIITNIEIMYDNGLDYTVDRIVKRFALGDDLNKSLQYFSERDLSNLEHITNRVLQEEERKIEERKKFNWLLKSNELINFLDKSIKDLEEEIEELSESEV